MTKSMKVEATLFSTAHPHISKYTSIYSILCSLSIAVIGIFSVVFSLNMENSSSTISMLLLTLGAVLILVALYRTFFKSAETVYLPTRSTISEGSCFVDSADLQKLQRTVEEKNFKQSAVAFKQSGNVRLDYMLSKDGKFAAVQLFHFVPYTYEPVSGIYYYTEDDATAFKKYLRNANN